MTLLLDTGLCAERTLEPLAEHILALCAIFYADIHAVEAKISRLSFDWLNASNNIDKKEHCDETKHFEL